MTLVRAGEVELDVERSGRTGGAGGPGAGGPPLLLIMGLSGTALHWGEPFLTELRRDFDVIAYDHRGVGASTRLAGGVTVAQMADDAAALLQELEIDSAHVLGISMGGMIAQELALDHPESVRTLTLGCTYCGGPGSALAGEEVVNRLSEAMMSGDRARAIRTGWEINVSPQFAAGEEQWRAFAAIAERRAVAVAVVMAQMQAVLGHDTSARLPELRVPTLVVHGTADEMLPVANGRLIASLIPDARLEIFDGVGHLFFWERPERSAELVRELAAVRA
jgi:pimeloyl-ACP methyl ester carboxylesterase